MSVTPNLQAVFNKWENRGPSNRQTDSNTQKILQDGRQKWKDRFGDRVVKSQFRRAKQKKLPVENVSLNIITQFKSSRILTGDSYIRTRPVMGGCCSCVPYSQKDFNLTVSPGIHNILDVSGGIRPRSFFDRQFQTLAYVLSRDTKHRYKDITKIVLSSQRVLEAVEKQTEKAINAKRKEILKKKPEEFLKTMAASISNRLVKVTAWCLLKILSVILRGVFVNKKQLAVIKKASEQGIPMIYLPLHLSHLDYILVTFILWSYDIKAPYVAAGNNLNIPVFNLLLRGLGGFFIRRKLDRVAGQKDLIYRAILHTYMQEILRSGGDLEFFIEGGRTRTGRAYHPKGGLLSVVMETLIDGKIEDAYLVPISINYDRILDGNFSSEEMGVPKKKETFFGAIQGLFRVLSRGYGSVRVDFSHPFSLKEYLRCNNPSSPRSDEFPGMPTPLHSFGSNVSLYGTDVVVEDERQSVDDIAQHVLYNSVHSQAIMSTNLVAFLLLNKHRQGTSIKQMVSDIDWLRGELKARKRDVGFVGETKDVIEYAVDLLTDELVTSDDSEIKPCTSMPNVFELSYYANPVISVFLMESVLACSVIFHCEIDMLSVTRQIEEVSANREDILSTAQSICNLLKYDFIFCPPCKRLEEELADTLDELVTSEVLKVQEDDVVGYTCRDQQRWARSLSATVSWDDEEDLEDVSEQIVKVNINRPESFSRLLFLYQVLGPILESYYLTALHITKDLKVELPEDSFLKEVHNHAKTRVEKGIASFAESASMSTFRNALKGFEDLNIVNIEYADNIRMVELRDHYQVWNKLNYYLELLENLRN